MARPSLRPSFREPSVGVEPGMGRVEPDVRALVLARHRDPVLDEDVDAALAVPRLDDAIAARVAHLRDPDRDALVRQGDELRADADLEALAVELRAGRVL